MPVWTALVFLVSITAATAEADDSLPQRKLSYHRDVEPIFRTHCFGCHQGAKQLGDYRMTEFTALVSGGETGEPAIVPGKPDESYLVDQITPIDGHAEMPKPPQESLHPTQIETVRRWIEQGARDDSPAPGPRYSTENPPTYSGAPTLPSLDVSPDGKLIAAAGLYEVLLVNVDTGALSQRLIGMSSRINSVRFSPSGERLAAVGGTPGGSGEIQIWDVESGDLLLSKPVTFDTLAGASWSPDGSTLAFGATDNVVRAIDTTTAEQVLFQGAHEDWVLDTVFTPSGKHLVSVGRDMSCKLTEVETERFVDNITSITPGALSGGLSSVDVHPERDEIVIGGADGIAKVYRVFRQTQRRIGDDANLIRVLPELPGRIFSVAISPDGSRLAAASTIDGHSELRVWDYDFDGELSDELKAILSKRVASRSAEEREQVQAYRNQTTKQVSAVSIADAAVYAVTFAPDGSLIFASDDGSIRRLAEGATTANVVYQVPIAAQSSLAANGFDAAAWQESVARRAESEVVEKGPAADQVESLIVEPSSVELDSPYAYAQVLVTAVLRDGSTVDVTRLCELNVPGWLSTTPRGLVRPLQDGISTGSVRFAGKEATFEIKAAGNKDGSVDFVRDVNPVLSRLGCNQGTCHGAQQGKNGFKLSLRGYDPLYDVRALTDDLAARRINAASPQDSLMLRKPVGRTPHEGGVLMREDDPYYTILRRWIANGSELSTNTVRVEGIELFPKNPVVQASGSRQQVRVVAHYEDGSIRDVTREAFIESGNAEVAGVDSQGLLAAVRRGEAPILARYEGSYAATTLTVMGDRRGYEAPEVENWNTIDELVAAKWERVKVLPSGLSDDATFLRRVYLDLTGLPPTSDQVRKFLEDKTPTRMKRAAVIDRLLVSDEFIDYWTNKWADLLQVNRKFLGVEGSKKLRKWIRRAIAENRPYDQIARQILTATGSNRRNPAASYFKVLRNPEDTMENTTHLFLGIRFNCNKCHDHPFERWTQDQYYELAAYFARVGLQPDPASGKRKVGGTAVEGAKPLFERVVDRDKGEVQHARTGEVASPEFPFPVEHDVPQEATRREQLASWITDADNPYFARSYVNRLWGYLLGKGLIEPIDDIRAGNPPTNPALLDYLTESFVDSGFDVRHMLRLICNSRTYQLDVATNPLNEDDQINYSHAMPRRLPAEVIYDAVHAATGSVSEIPGVDKGTRAAALTDSGVKLPDGFLQNLGRPVRESACECERSSELQLGPVMALINGQTIGSAISDPKNELERIVKRIPDDRLLVEEIYLRLLGRYPKDGEWEVFQKISQQIEADHQQLADRLEKAEAAWKIRRAKLEEQRKSRLTDIKQQIVSRTEAIQPERERLEAERLKRIEKAEQELQAAKANLDTRVSEWEKKQQDQVEWFPLQPQQLQSTADAKLLALQDRSVVATGDATKGVYTITATTSLPQITGFRLEAIADEDLPADGPGLAENGNFVLTEFEIDVAPAGEPDKKSTLKIARGEADFLQSSFQIEQTFDGRKRDQRGWAVAGATGTVHWATFQLKKPIESSGEVVLTFRLHQFHNAAKHRLGRFRISATTADEKKLPLGLAESLAAAVTTPEDSRREAEKELLRSYVAATDEPLQKAKAAVSEARKPVPPDAELERLRKLEQKLSEETADDPSLVRLRQDMSESTAQQKKRRLTAAEDLVWALINSPAFLFNH